MSYHDVVRRTWDDEVLFSALLELTYRCNLDCSFCYNDLSLVGRPLSLAQYERLLDDLAALGTMHLILSGGEPLAHPHFLELGARARALGFVVRVKSNGHALRGALARKVRDQVDPFLVEVSLHGACADTHDRQTRVEGSFERLIGNLTELRELGLRIKLNSTLTRWNEAEVEEMYALADTLGFPLQFDPEVTPRDDGDTSPLDLSASVDGIRRLLRVQRERSGASAREDTPGRLLASAPSDKHCGAGSSGIAIDPFGNVYPCVQWRRAVGSLHEKGIADLWQGSSVLAEVRETTVEVRRTLLGMGAGAPVSFCPGAAEASTGSPFALTPQMVKRRQAEQSGPGRSSLPVLA